MNTRANGAVHLIPQTAQVHSLSQWRELLTAPSGYRPSPPTSTGRSPRCFTPSSTFSGAATPGR